MNSEKKIINRCLWIYTILLCFLCYFIILKAIIKPLILGVRR